MIELKLNRKRHTNLQTIGVMDVFKDDLYQFSLMTLEREWLNNEKNISCIPKGFYIIDHYNSNKHPNTFVLLNTEPRTSILIHTGNYYHHTAGCILVGCTFSDINEDGKLDVKYSTEALDKLRKICEGESIINITIS